VKRAVTLRWGWRRRRGPHGPHRVAEPLRPHSENNFLATVLARENQHEHLCSRAQVQESPRIRVLVVYERAFADQRDYADRVELIGLSFTAQHSDARVLDQLIYSGGIFDGFWAGC